ncbi:MAG: class I SAM-dependent methyltransferase [Microthrixaceae bacterium]|nr:class I SAM-dependent methyltransferase [Microthrixaceae bacterium]
MLEIGSGPGANAGAILDRHRTIELTATDLDPVMVASARRRLASYGHRVVVSEADATDLPFDDDHFDTVVSLLMLHHVITWRDDLEHLGARLAAGAVDGVIIDAASLTQHGVADLVSEHGAHRTEIVTDLFDLVCDP